MSVQNTIRYSSFRNKIRNGYRTIRFSEEEQGYLREYKNKTNYSQTKPLEWGAKRAIDFMCGLAGMIITAPIVGLSAIAIKLETKGDAIFKQKRIGKDGKPFDIYKLRTMYADRSNDGQNVLDPNDKRITKVGKFLRKYSIDEFPQFFNIFRGDMSLIGPRPLPPYVHKEAKDFPEFAGRYAVKPGIKLEYSKADVENPRERFAVEKEYMENWSPKKDIHIVSRVLLDVLGGKNY